MKKLFISAALSCTLLFGCGETGYSPQEILQETMEETTALTSFYGEYTIKMSDGVEMYAKQWTKNGKSRIEMNDSTGQEVLTINDGYSVMSYEPAQKTAYIFKSEDGSMSYLQPTIQEQALQTLELISDTHKIEAGKDAKIAGRDTYHLIATATSDNTLIGDMEIWVDKKTWMVLKTVSLSGDLQMTSEYTVFETDAKIDDAQFEANLPADTVINEEIITAPVELTLEEAKAKLGEFLTFPAESGYTITMIEDMNMAETNEIAISYEKDGSPQMNISIFQPQEALTFIEDEEIITIRGQQGSMMDMQGFRFLQWEESGLRYNVLLENDALTMEEAIAHLGLLQ